MTTDRTEAARPDAGRGHGTAARVLHWATVVGLAVILPAGIAMTGEGFRSASSALYVLHKGGGVIVLLLVVVRLIWKAGSPPVDPLPETVAPLERRWAAGTHALLYGLLLFMGLSGYARTVAGGFPIELLDVVGVPPLLPEMPGLAVTLSVLHSFAGYLLVAVVALHVGAVARHAWVVRDGVPGRMWPPRAPRSGSPPVSRPGEGRGPGEREAGS
ncbi:MAG: cytochrome b/b6 domain-containing protein [Gemmatimonadetes bacterium]|nr:cytochrome b/b6 domain-containing protein [Gemmatimonadota bacterium]